MNDTLRRLSDLMLDAVFLVKESGCITYVNPACEGILGYRAEEMIGRQMLDFIHPEDRQRTIEEMERVAGGRPGFGFENRYLHKAGHAVDLMWTARWSEPDQLRIGVARDVSARKRSDARQAGMLAISTAANGADSLDGMFASFHDTLKKLLPMHAMAAVLEPGRRLAYASAEAQDSARWHCEPMSTAAVRFGELRVDCPAVISGSDRELLQFAAGQAAAAIERLALQANLEYAARYDDLTGLPNRRLFQDRMQSAFARCRRGHSGGALLFIDLDDFKRVNDEHGHAIGDLLLQAVAGRIRGCLREADTVARIGGDEFIALLENVGGEDDAQAIALKIRHAIATPLQVGVLAVMPNASIGLALFPQHGEGVDQLMRHADQAMYADKTARKASQAVEKKGTALS